LGYWNKQVFTSILLGILFSILFASAVDSQSGEEKSIASIPLIQPASAQQSSPPAGYIVQESYSKDCGERPSGTVCARYSDGYIWLISDSVRGWDDVQEDGKNIEVAVGFKHRYYHIPNTNFVKTGPLIIQAAPEPEPEPTPTPTEPEPVAEPAPGYIAHESYFGNCKLTPVGTECIIYPDGYIWLVTDSIQDWEGVQEDGKNVQVAVGNNARYYHILNTIFVKADSLITQGTQVYIEQKPYRGDCDETRSGSVCIEYPSEYLTHTVPCFLSPQSLE